MPLRVHAVPDEAALERALRTRPAAAVIDNDPFMDAARKERIMRRLKRAGVPFIAVSAQKDREAILRSAALGASDTVLRPFNQREFIMRFNAVVQKKKRVACIGGGTGLFTLLLGIKTLPNALVISIVNMSDDGGSSGKLSQMFGILPPGDIRRSLVALSNAPDVMNQIIQHRFEKRGDLHGHSFGNIFLTVLAEVKGSMSEAVKALSDILNIQGIVLPATRTLTSLVARFSNGAVVKGESKIDRCVGRPPQARVKRLWHDPPPECDAEAFSSLVHADLIVIGPGDLFTSVATNLVVADIREAVVRSRAKKVYVCNLMTKPGETWGYDAADHAREIVRYLGKDCLDSVIVSNTCLSEEAIEEYARKDQKPVAPPAPARLRRVTHAKLILADVGNETELVRHDSAKLRDEIARLIAHLPQGKKK